MNCTLLLLSGKYLVAKKALEFLTLEDWLGGVRRTELGWVVGGPPELKLLQSTLAQAGRCKGRAGSSLGLSRPASQGPEARIAV